jgi:hypothetical protein
MMRVFGKERFAPLRLLRNAVAKDPVGTLLI